MTDQFPVFFLVIFRYINTFSYGFIIIIYHFFQSEIFLLNNLGFNFLTRVCLADIQTELRIKN